MPHQDLHEVRSAIALTEGYGRVWGFDYHNAKHDPRPQVLVLGHWRHPSSKNDLVGGINLNYLSQGQRRELQAALPKLLQPRNLRQRYWVGRRLLPQIFTSFYRTYDKDHIDAVTTATLKFDRQATKQLGDQRRQRLAKLAAAVIARKQTTPQMPTLTPDQTQQAVQDLRAIQPPPTGPEAPVDLNIPGEPNMPGDFSVPGPQYDLAQLGGQPPPEEIEQERHLPPEPAPEDTLEGQTQGGDLEPDPTSDMATDGSQDVRVGSEQPPRLPAERRPKPRRLPPEGRVSTEQPSNESLGLECRLLGAHQIWSSRASFIRWHDPAMVLTEHPIGRRPLLDYGRGPVLAVYDLLSGRTVVGRAEGHAALLAEAGWDFDHVVRFAVVNDRIVAMIDDTAGRHLDKAWRGVRGLNLLTD